MNNANQSHIDSLCTTINRAFITYFIVYLFLIYQLLRSDENLFKGGIDFNLSFTSATLPYSTFLLLASIVIVVLYLWMTTHICILNKLEREIEQCSLSTLPSSAIVPRCHLFTTDIKTIKYSFQLIYKYTPPIFLLFLCRKLAPVFGAYFSVFLFLCFLLSLWSVTELLLFYRIKRKGMCVLFLYGALHIVIFMMYFKVSFLTPRYLDLAYADLSGKIFDGFNFEGANFFKANLENASLKGCNLTGADLRGAILKGANFSMRKELGLALNDFFPVGFLLVPTYGEGADFTNAKLDQSDVTGADFTETIISESQLSVVIGRDRILKDSMSYTIGE